MTTIRRTNRLAELSLNHYDNESFDKTLCHIRESGVGIISVAGDDRSLGWTYSTGLFDTYGQPEIILTGFPAGLAQFIVNEVGKHYLDGKRMEVNQRTEGFIGNNIDVIFKPVAKVWVNRLMLRTSWYYGNDDFPVSNASALISKIVSLGRKISIFHGMTVKLSYMKMHLGIKRKSNCGTRAVPKNLSNDS